MDVDGGASADTREPSTESALAVAAVLRRSIECAAEGLGQRVLGRIAAPDPRVDDLAIEPPSVGAIEARLRASVATAERGHECIVGLGVMLKVGQRVACVVR